MTPDEIDSMLGGAGNVSTASSGGNPLRDSMLLYMSKHSKDSAVAYMNAYLHYKKNIYWQAQEALKDRTATYAWQHRTSRWIFFIVVLVVLIGITFSAAHFYNAMRRENRLLALQEKKQERKKQPETGKEGDDKQPETDTATSIEVSSSGIKISSSLVGIIVLFFSLLFFFLYLKFVYPINETKLDRIDVQEVDVNDPAK